MISSLNKQQISYDSNFMSTTLQIMELQSIVPHTHRLPKHSMEKKIKLLLFAHTMRRDLIHSKIIMNNQHYCLKANMHDKRFHSLPSAHIILH